MLSDCIVVSNGWRHSADGSGSSRTGGRGIHAEGGAFYATNCVIAYNGPYRTQTSSGVYGDSGFGIYFSSIAAELVGCINLGRIGGTGQASLSKRIGLIILMR